MKPKFRLFVLFAILGSVLLASCASTEPPPDATDPVQPVANEPTPLQPSVSESESPDVIDACKLLTQSDAEMLLGQSVGEAEHPVEGAATFIVSSCKYRVQGGSAFDNAYVIVTIPVGGSVESATIAFNTDKSQAEEMLGATPVDVAGVGDSAYWVGGYGNQLAVLSGNVHIIFSVSTLEGDTPPQAVIDFVKTMLGRL